MRAGVVALAFVVLVVAGCSSPSAGPSTGTSSPSPTSSSGCTNGANDPVGCSCPPDTYPGGYGCLAVHQIRLFINGEGNGSYAVGVPFPHGSWCLQPEDWKLDSSTINATLEVREVDRGTVLWLTGHDQSYGSAHIVVEGRATCQTLGFRYDPWSIEPDPADETVEVQVEGSASRIEVTVADAEGACSNATAYAAPVAAGWSVLAQTFTGRLSCF